MNPCKIFVESMQQAGIDQFTIDTVAAIHNAIYEAAEDDSDDDDKDENEEKDNDKGNKEGMADDKDFGPEGFDSEDELPTDNEPEETPSEAANESNVDEGAKAIMYNILTLMNAKQSAYQQYHWNAESKSLH